MRSQESRGRLGRQAGDHSAECQPDRVLRGPQKTGSWRAEDQVLGDDQRHYASGGGRMTSAQSDSTCPGRSVDSERGWVLGTHRDTGVKGGETVAATRPVGWHCSQLMFAILQRRVRRGPNAHVVDLLRLCVLRFAKFGFGKEPELL